MSLRLLHCALCALASLSPARRTVLCARKIYPRNLSNSERAAMCIAMSAAASSEFVRSLAHSLCLRISRAPSRALLVPLPARFSVAARSPAAAIHVWQRESSERAEPSRVRASSAQSAHCNPLTTHKPMACRCRRRCCRWRCAPRPLASLRAPPRRPSSARSRLASDADSLPLSSASRSQTKGRSVCARTRRRLRQR